MSANTPPTAVTDGSNPGPDAFAPDSFFSVFEGSLSPGFCEAVIARFDKDPQVKPGVYGNGTREGALDTNIKQTTEINLDGKHTGWRDEERMLMQSLNRHLQQYMERWGQAFPCELFHEPLKIARYPVGGHFDWHSDNMGNGVTTRVITVLWYLNDVAEGGETEYPWQGMAVKPARGRLLMCPVGWTYIHRGAPPLTEPKYIAITQLHQRSTETV